MIPTPTKLAYAVIPPNKLGTNGWLLSVHNTHRTVTIHPWNREHFWITIYIDEEDKNFIFRAHEDFFGGKSVDVPVEILEHKDLLDRLSEKLDSFLEAVKELHSC